MKLARTAALIALALPALAMAATPPQYAITDLGVVAGQTYSQTFGASSNGAYVVGRTLTAEGQTGAWPSFIWNAGTGMVSQANVAGRDYSWGYGINNSGVAVGIASAATDGSGAIPVMWSNGSATTLKLPNGYDVGHANAINNNGIAVGSVGYDINETGAIYNTITGKTTVINTVADDGTYMLMATGVSDTGLVVGAGVDGSSREVAVVYNMNNGSLTTLQMPDFAGDYNSSYAVGISPNGKYIVGASGNATQPFIWSAETGALVASFAGDSSSGILEAVNDQGWALGNTGGVYSNPVLVEGGQTFLISDLISNPAGWNFTTTTSASAMSISADGTIFGTAQINGIEHAYMLTAVPEPSSYALMLGGLLAIGAITRRRSAARA